MKPTTKQSLPRDEWETPIKLFNFLDTVFDFEVDLAASKENALCDVYHSKENPYWNYTGYPPIWCNPPYSMCKEFADWFRVVDNPNAAVLMPVRSDRIWFTDWLYEPDWRHMWFTGRLHFGMGTDDGKKGGFLYNILFYRHPTLILPNSISAAKFNPSGKGGAHT